jgi:hypothetical protein
MTARFRRCSDSLALALLFRSLSMAGSTGPVRDNFFKDQLVRDRKNTESESDRLSNQKVFTIAFWYFIELYTFSGESNSIV